MTLTQIVENIENKPSLLPISFSSRHLLSSTFQFKKKKKVSGRLSSEMQNNQCRPLFFQAAGPTQGSLKLHSCLRNCITQLIHAEPTADSDSQLGHLPPRLFRGGCFLNSVQQDTCFFLPAGKCQVGRDAEEPSTRTARIPGETARSSVRRGQAFASSQFLG